MTEIVLLAYSGGKDSNLALHQILNDPNLEVAALLVTLTEDYRRISMHGVPEALLDLQGSSIGLPLEKVWIPAKSDNRIYEQRMQAVLEKHNKRGIRHVVFGDLFLQDIREYRENQLARVNMEAIFPLWGRDTRELSRQFIDAGFKGITCCVDSHSLGKQFTGCRMNEEFFNSLPSGVDPCGENGEYHSFVYDGPIFSYPVAIGTGEIILRDQRFYYCDLIPEEINPCKT